MIKIKNIDNFSLKDTFECGQCFRFSENADSSYSGIAHGKLLRLEKSGKTLTIHGINESEYKQIWEEYFDLTRDYGEIIRIISADETLKKASEFGFGIRVLKQEPWETLCSFIISQNNNIKRIKGIVSRLCECFGEKIEGGFAFPSAECLSILTTEDLAPIRAGFRAKYIIDAAQKVADGRVDFERVVALPLDDAREHLKLIKGVGDKVADCTLLFGFGRITAFPKDVWIKRALEKYFGGRLPEVATPYAGIAQQYIFNYMLSQG